MRMPKDENQKTIPLVTPRPALAVTFNSTISAAVDITLNTATTLIEVNALSQGVFLRYQSTVSSVNFDEYIQAGAVRHYIKPTGVTVISVIQQAATGAVIIIEK